jgi:Protein of unknown function (DUF3224)
MTTHASARFEIKSWDEAPYLELDEGRKFTRAAVTQLVSGDIEGDSTSETLMYYRPDGTAAYLGFTHVVGRIGDREGSFVLRSTGEFDGTTARQASVVVPGSGTGALAGLSGSGESASTHADYPHVPFTLDYEIG